MLGENVLVRRTVIWHIRMMVLTENIGRPFEGMVADPPATLCVTVHLAYAGIDTHAHGADQGGLSQVGAEPGPEVVIHVWSAMKSARVQREPMAETADGGDEERYEYDDEENDSKPGGSVPRAVGRKRRGRRRCCGAACGGHRVA